MGVVQTRAGQVNKCCGDSPPTLSLQRPSVGKSFPIGESFSAGIPANGFGLTRVKGISLLSCKLASVTWPILAQNVHFSRMTPGSTEK